MTETHTVVTFVPVGDIEAVVLSHGGAEVRVEREIPFATSDEALAAKLRAHPSCVAVGEETFEAPESGRDGEAGDGEAEDAEPADDQED